MLNAFMMSVVMQNAIMLNVVTPSFPWMVMPKDQAPISLSLEEVVMHCGHNVLVESDNKSALIVGDPQRILDQ
jgi:hypothetical protein